MKKKVVVFVPTFNEEQTINKVLSAIPQEVLGHPTEIVIADDCSTDRTVALAKRHTQHIIRSEINQGVGMTTKLGMRYIARKFPDAAFVVKFDGDGQHKLDYLKEMVMQLLAGRDLVICSRFHPLSDQDHTPTDRILLNMIFTEMVRKITGWKITDARSGYMGFPFRYVPMLASDLIVPRYGVPMEIILRIWNDNADALTHEIPHPTMYGPDTSKKLREKYSSETTTEKADRLQMAYQALLMVIENLNIPREYLLEMNGFTVKAEYVTA